MSDCHERGETRTAWRARPDGLEESVQFTPGYNCPVTGGQGHGVHGMEVTWYLRGPAGGAQFKIYTDWIPGNLYPGHGLPPVGSTLRFDKYPMGADVGYHARRPQYEGDEPISDDCPITGGLCYYDGSGLRAHNLVPEFVRYGEAIIWAELEAVYVRLVEEEAEAARVASST